jgi:hypothetical protein
MKRAAILRRHFCGLSAWLLALALVLPLAQLAGAMHAYVHLQDPAATRSDKHAPGSSTCDLCVLAAAIGGTAPGSTPAGAPLAQLEHAAPADPASAPPFAAAPAHYRSRAPPALLA